MKRILLLLALLTTFLATVGSVSALQMEVTNFRYSAAVNPDDRYYAVDVKLTSDKGFETGLVEIDLINANNALAFFSGLKTCDPNFPYNVHRTYGVGDKLFSSFTDSTKFTLTGRNIPDGTYKAVLVHYTGCAKDGGVQKDPNKWLVLKEQVVFGQAGGNVLDQCDNEYEAMQYLKRKGVLNCRVAVCDDASTSSSKARCVNSGECNTGSVQSKTCLDGSTITIRECINANWVATGLSCPGQPLPPEPPITPPGPIKTGVNWGALIIVVVIILVVLAVLRRMGIIKVKLPGGR